MPQDRKTLLLAGGGYADIPLIRAAQALGYYVITSGNRSDDLGHQYSDECQLEDFSDRDAMLRLAKRAKIDAICACCNDFSALTSAYVAEALGLPGHDPLSVAETIHHKDRYRQFAQDNEIPSPRALGFEDLDSAIAALHEFAFPLIIKPVDLTGGKGITKVTDASSARQALEAAFEMSKAKRVVVEEFVEGSRHGLSTFVRDGKVVFHFSDDEHYYKNPYMVSAASSPGTPGREPIDSLIATTERIVSLLSLKSGIFHIQYILRENEPLIIEICRRAPGDLYLSLVQKATGRDYASDIVSAACGLDCSAVHQVDVNGYYTRHCVMPDREGVVTDVVFAPSIRNYVIDRFMWWKPGYAIVDPMTQKLGIVFLRFGSIDEMLSLTPQLPTLIRPQYSP